MRLIPVAPADATGFAVDPAGTRVYMVGAGGCAGARGRCATRVQEIDARAGTLGRTIALTTPGPAQAVPVLDARARRLVLALRVFTGLREETGEIATIDLAASHPHAIVTVPLHLRPDRRRAAIDLAPAGRAPIVDEVTGCVFVPLNEGSPAVAPSGRGGASSAESVAVVDTRTGACGPSGGPRR